MQICIYSTDFMIPSICNTILTCVHDRNIKLNVV